MPNDLNMRIIFSIGSPRIFRPTHKLEYAKLLHKLFKLTNVYPSVFFFLQQKIKNVTYLEIEK